MLTTDATSFYVTGGTLRPDTPSYVERQADRELYEGLLRGEYCYVLHARQMGKSSLMVHTAGRLRAAGVQVAILDLTAIGQNLSPEQWYGGLLRRLGRQLDASGALEEELEERGFEQETRVGPLERWLAALEQSILPRVAGQIVIFIDEIDAVRSLPFSTDEFFAAIRECYNRRSQEAEYERLTFCLLGVATPSDLIQDTRTTPFNIGQRIELTDFTEAEAAPLARGFDRNAESGQALLARVLFWTDGHPYLTQRLCQAVAADEKVTDRQGVDRHCEILFLSPSAREKDDNLLFVRDRLLRSDADRSSLLDLYARVRAGKQVGVDDTNPLIDLLRLSGIARTAGGHLRVRNRIYERVFDREWVITHLPDAELRRQRAAYRRGLLRASATAAVVVAVMAGLAGAALHQSTRARAAATRFRDESVKSRRLLYLANMNLAPQVWENSNVGRIRSLLEETGDSPERGFEWAYWQRLCHLDLMTLAGHTRDLMAVAYSPDGTRLVTGSFDGTAKLWDARTGREIFTLRGQGPLSRIALSDGKPVVPIYAATFTPAGKQIVTGSLDGTARVWDARSGRETMVLPLNAPVFTLAVSPDGQRIVAGCLDRAPQVWQIATGRPRKLLTLQGYTGDVRSVAFSPDGKQIVTLTFNQPMALWDAATGRKLLTFPSLSVGASSVDFSPDGVRLVTSGYYRTAVVWDTRTGKPLRRIERGPALSVAFSPDGRRIVTGRGDGTATIWDVSTQHGQALLTLRGHRQSVDAVAFSPDGRRIVTGSADGTAKIWDATIDRSGPVFRWHDPSFSCAALSPDGTRVVAGRTDGTIALRELGGSPPGTGSLRVKGHAAVVTAVAFSRDGERILTGGADRTTIVWDAAGRRLMTLKGQAIGSGERSAIGSAISTVAFSPSSRRIAAGTQDGIVQVWDTTGGRGRASFTLAGLGGPVVAALFTLDGQRLVTAVDYGVAPLRVWDAATGRELLTFHSTEPVLCAALSPDGRYLLTGGHVELSSENVNIWDMETGRRKHSFRETTSTVSAVAFSPDGRRLATDGSQGTVILWDAATGRETLTLKEGKSWIYSVAFSRDGRRLFAAGDDGAHKQRASARMISVWEAASEPQIAAWQQDERRARERQRRPEQPRATVDPMLWDWTLLDSTARAAQHHAAAGRPALARQERERGAEILRRALARQEQSADGLNALAWFCASRNLYLSEALQAAKRANKLRPNSVEILDTLAYVHFRRGHVAQAIAIETRALAIDPLRQGYKDRLAWYRKQKKQPRGEKRMRGESR